MTEEKYADQCPHCGSEDGYTYFVTQTFEQYVGWNGEPWAADDSQVRSSDRMTLPKCMSCDKRVKNARPIDKLL